jgi:hypothetical protein
MSWNPIIGQNGEEYYGFVCANSQCAVPLLMGKIDPKDLDPKGGVQIQSQQANHTLTCPQCGHTAVYPIGNIQRILVVTKH